jgi:hypothetical protein
MGTMRIVRSRAIGKNRWGELSKCIQRTFYLPDVHTTSTAGVLDREVLLPTRPPGIDELLIRSIHLDKTCGACHCPLHDALHLQELYRGREPAADHTRPGIQRSLQPRVYVFDHVVPWCPGF